MAVRSIYLVGFSGTGKSTVAAAVAARLGWPAVDLDRRIAERAGLAIPAIFEREGEAGFRDRETAALREVAAAGPAVVATGGGAPLRPENRRLMEESGWVVALEGRPELLQARLERQRALDDPEAPRPLLEGTDPLERIRALKAARQPVYALADWTVHTDRLAPAEVAEEILRARERLEDAGPGGQRR